MPVGVVTTWPGLSAVTRLGERCHPRHDLITTQPADSRVKDPSDGGAAAQTVQHKVKVLLLSRTSDIQPVVESICHCSLTLSCLILSPGINTTAETHLCCSHLHIWRFPSWNQMMRWWDEALEQQDALRFTVGLFLYLTLCHQCEEDVGDDIIHRRQKHWIFLSWPGERKRAMVTPSESLEELRDFRLGGLIMSSQTHCWCFRPADMFGSSKLKHSTSDSADKNGVKNRLKKFITRRPSMKTLQEKGLIKGLCFCFTLWITNMRLLLSC